MRMICLIDTSVFCNIVQVPNRCQQREKTNKRLRQFIETGTILLLPLAVIYETGNHISQQGDGRQRRQTAERFIHQVRSAFDGHSPFTPTYLPQIEEMRDWLTEFPDQAMRGVGMGDLSIIKEWERQCTLNPYDHVFIWAYDDHLNAHNRKVK